MRDSLVFYRSFAEAIRCLPEDDQLKAFWNILDYALDGEEPTGSGAALAVFKMAKPQIDTNEKRYENGTKGGRTKPNNNQIITKTEPNNNQIITKTEPKQNQTITKQEPNNNQTGTKPEPNVNVNVNDNVNDKRESKREKFTPPTPEQVKEYAEEKGYAIDAERFVDFYQSKGWKVGKDSMKDWKAAVRNWSRSEKPARKEETAKPKRNIVNDFDQRDYDYDELERQLLRRTYGGG